ncbi:MAG: hypothetical protein ACI4NG_05360 [Candidatus Gallimonas sp.]
MRFAHSSVRKRKDDTEEKDEPLFCDAGEAVKRALSEIPIGKVLFVSDENGFGAFAPFSRSPRAVGVISASGDALPLFSMPDGITLVLAAGDADTMRAARYFATVRKIPCRLFPTDGALDGVYSEADDVLLGEARSPFPLDGGRVILDESLLRESLPRAYCRLLLSRLALFEARALRLLCGGERSTADDRAFSATERIGEDFRSIVAQNAALRRCEREGAPVGEGVSLARLLARDGAEDAEWRAYVQLSALYGAFFHKGVPRRYAVPDYRARAEEAGTGEAGYLAAEIPTTETYFRRATSLERVRGILLRELDCATKLSSERRVFRMLGGRDRPRAPERLRLLPETCPRGLSALIRDFGLTDSLSEIVCDDRS